MTEKIKNYQNYISSDPVPLIDHSHLALCLLGLNYAQVQVNTDVSLVLQAVQGSIHLPVCPQILNFSSDRNIRLSVAFSLVSFQEFHLVQRKFIWKGLFPELFTQVFTLQRFYVSDLVEGLGFSRSTDLELFARSLSLQMTVLGLYWVHLYF